jgi:hypothetical protein
MRRWGLSGTGPSPDLNGPRPHTVMQLSADAGTRSAHRGWLARGLPALLETASVLAAIVLLLPAFARVAEFGSGRDQRFAEAGLQVKGLPEPVVPAVCATFARLVDAPLREQLCGCPPWSSKRCRVPRSPSSRR